MMKWKISLQAGVVSINIFIRNIILLMGFLIVGVLSFSVELRLPRYVPQGGSALLYCEYNVSREDLHKVEWQRGNKKLMQFVMHRIPPFRYFNVVGAVIDRNCSNERHLMLRDLDLDATGYYFCKVLTSSPIFTRTSNEEELTVIQPQKDEPEVIIRKSLYTIGEILEANCSSSPAHPVPHITWLLNGNTVPDEYLRFFPNQQVSSSTVQLSVLVDYSQLDAGGRLQLSCVSTIPAFLGPQADPRLYADYQLSEMSVEVVIPQQAVDRARRQLRPQLLIIATVAIIIGTSQCLLGQ